MMERKLTFNAYKDVRLSKLYSLGTYYLYGMLFRNLFSFRELVQPSRDLLRLDSHKNDDNED